MKNSFLVSCVVALLLRSCAGWIITDINPEMLGKSVLNDVDDVQAASLLKRINFIFPGTKWCGAGDIADDYDDLGTERETDMCCRDHDYCPDIIVGGETKYNLTNNLFYTRLSCACDSQFYNCLKAANTTTSKLIGNIYFNALLTKCFREDYVTVKCIRRGGYARGTNMKEMADIIAIWVKQNCLEYTYDTNGGKVYQWFDVEDF